MLYWERYHSKSIYHNLFEWQQPFCPIAGRETKRMFCALTHIARYAGVYKIAHTFGMVAMLMADDTTNNAV